MSDRVTPDGLDGAKQAYAELAIRGGVARGMEDNDQVMRAAVAARPQLRPLLHDHGEVMSEDEYMEAIDWSLAKWHRAEGARLLCFAGPSGQQWYSDELPQGCIELARRDGDGWHMRPMESKVQATLFASKSTRSLVSQPRRSRACWGPKSPCLIVCGCTTHTCTDLAEANARVCHNPVCSPRVSTMVARSLKGQAASSSRRRSSWRQLSCERLRPSH